MLGWLIVAVVVGLAIWEIVGVIKAGDSELLFLGIMIIMSVAIYPVSHYCMYKIEPIPRLEAYEKTIEQTKALVKDREINLQDMEITKTLAKVIGERNGYIASLKVAKRNPFCLFKPTIKLDKEDK